MLYLGTVPCLGDCTKDLGLPEQVSEQHNYTTPAQARLLPFRLSCSRTNRNWRSDRWTP